MSDRRLTAEVSRRDFCKRALAAAAVTIAPAWLRPHPAHGSGPCPEVDGETIRWIVPTSPGGGYDQYSRLIEPFYESRLGAEIVIENLPGAGMIRGSRRIMEAEPNGRTLGILNAGALLMARMGGDQEAPDPAADFTVLGRISLTPQIWATGGDSPLRSLSDVFALARERPIVFGITEFGANNPVNAVVASRILGIESALVPGYQGSSGISLAAIRGEIDVAPLTYEARVGSMETGDLTPILQVSMSPISSHPSLEGVPCLGGENGAAAVRAAELGRDVEEAKAEARALCLLLGAGRLAAAPANLPPGLAACLEEQLRLALDQPECRAAAELAHLEIDLAGGAEACADLTIAREAAGRFAPLLEEAKRRVRD
ncbi:MAG: tripartite tricarboxylate transporter substrate-binding protein [Candidatus Eisenbacteria bacterium]